MISQECLVHLNTGRSKLKQSFQTLQVRWDNLCQGWDDAARREFGENHWEPVGPDVQAALRAIDRLAAVLSQMQNECS